MALSLKERDNTWLQLPICPTLWRQREAAAASEKEAATIICNEDQSCHINYAHPPIHVLKQALASGYVVSCQSYVFFAYGPDDGSIARPNCKRGEDVCRYYHPPKHLGLLVINAGRNNKRLRQEMTSKMRVMQQQHQFQQATAAHMWAAATTSQPLLYQMMAPPPFNLPSLYNQQRPTLVVPPGTAEVASTSALLRKRPRTSGTLEQVGLSSPEPKRRSMDLESVVPKPASFVAAHAGQLEYQQLMAAAMQPNVIFYDPNAYNYAINPQSFKYQ